MTELWLHWDSGYQVPEHTKRGFEDYILRGYPPGSFMASVLRNDFVAAVCHADHVNREHLPDIAKWMINNAPRACWGNEQAIRDWLADKDGRRTEFYEYHEKKRVWELLKEQA